MALPNLAALRLGHGPELDTAGRAGTFLSAIAARERWSLYANQASGKDTCPVSFEEFKNGDPIWIGESGHYYHPWVYYRAYKTTGRDPCGNVPIPDAEVQRLERELWKIVAAGRLPDASERQKWAARETRKVLRRAGVDVGEPDGFDPDVAYEPPHPAGMISMDELEHAVGLDAGRGYSDGEDASGGFRGQNYTHAELEMLRMLLDMDEDTSGVPVPIDTSSLLRAAHPGSNFLWTNPLAGGELGIRWHVQYTRQPDGSFGNKSSAFVLNLPLGEGKLFTNLLRAHASPDWQLLERNPTDLAQWHLGARGSLLALRTLVLKALLIGDDPLPLTDGQIDILAGRLDELDFHVTFQEAFRPISITGRLRPAQVGVTVSAALMSHLLAPGTSSALQGRVTAPWVPYPREHIPSPPVDEGWGNLDNPDFNGLPPGWERGSSATDRAQADRNWANGANRMVRMANNLAMLTLQVDPNSNPPGFVVPPVSVRAENWWRHHTPASQDGQGADVHNCEVEVPFWYALDAYTVDTNENVDLGNGMRIAQINGRAGVPAPARAW